MTDQRLFAEQRLQLGAASWLLPGYALGYESELLKALQNILEKAPLRCMMTPTGPMSVKTSSCGMLGWVSDRKGYRYSSLDPETGKPWPCMPASFSRLATSAAQEAGFGNFVPDSCLINQYDTGTKMGLHQDKNEIDFSRPIVSVSLGIPAIFLFGGLKRSDRAMHVPLAHGDVVVWGGEDRLRFHGILPMKQNQHPALGCQRINLTFRKAG